MYARIRKHNNNNNSLYTLPVYNMYITHIIPLGNRPTRHSSCRDESFNTKSRRVRCTSAQIPPIHTPRVQ